MWKNGKLLKDWNLKRCIKASCFAKRFRPEDENMRCDYQGDNAKATFYIIPHKRVDSELILVMAASFHIVE
jgi:hypothetical protein